MRVFAGAFGTETNTFSPLPTGLDAYREACWFPAGTHPDTMQFVAGPLWAARQRALERGWTLSEGLVAFAAPAGPTTRVAHETLRDLLLADLAAALPVDVVLLGMHGAMVADGCDDCEGDLLARVRALVGPDVVIGVEVDPHTHLSAAMVEHATLIVAFKEYPHTDVLDRAFDLVDLCEAAAQGRIHPVAAVHDCGMIAVLHTSRQPMRGFVDRLLAAEGTGGLLSISPIHGFPWGDTPDMGTKLLAYADGDPALAHAAARRFGQELETLRLPMRAPFVSIDAAIDRVQAAAVGCFVLADGPDNSGGGAPSDATWVLRRLHERGVRDVALGPLWDPVAVSIAFNAGQGARLDLRIGGKICALSGEPFDANVTVRALQRNHTMSGLSPDTRLGDCALVEFDGIVVLLSSLRVQAMGTDMFCKMGLDPATRRCVVVKSSQHFWASYSKIATEVIYLDCPGVLTNDWSSLPYRKVPRPKLGIDG